MCQRALLIIAEGIKLARSERGGLFACIKQKEKHRWSIASASTVLPSEYLYSLSGSSIIDDNRKKVNYNFASEYLYLLSGKYNKDTSEAHLKAKYLSLCALLYEQKRRNWYVSTIN